MFNYLFYFLFIFYEENIYRYIADISLTNNLLNYLLGLILGALILGLFTNLLPIKIKHIFFHNFNFILCSYYLAASMVRKIFGISISLESIEMYKQFTSGGFLKASEEILLENILLIILIFIPFIIGLILKNKISNEFDYRYLLELVTIYIFFLGTLNSNSYDLYFKRNSNELNIENFGIYHSANLEIIKKLLGQEEVINNEIEVEKETVTSYSPQLVYDINKINSNNNTIMAMNDYFNNQKPTYTNDYTGIFKDKNLIYIMAESFDGYMVNEELTPTLYKMIHEGFDFTNYYSPTNLSTIGGEFSLLTALLPNLSTLNSKWNTNTNYFPYGLATLFKSLNYQTYAYHNHLYSYQGRDNYLKAEGFDNYIGCGNGLEKRMNCSIFPASDDEMIKVTLDDYLNDSKFMVYYATVSGHGKWGTYHEMAKRNYETVKGLDYSTTVKSYIAANLELEKAMTSLLEALEAKGILDDTVIVLAADHHPYFMEDYQMNELAHQELDQFSLYKNNLIIYSSTLKHQSINKPCSTIDVLPTVLNLFGISYDSRLFNGKDILSSDEGLVIFADHSWISDKGSYSYKKREFIGEGSSDYIKLINEKVNNSYIIAKNILQYDYYRLLVDSNS